MAHTPQYPLHSTQGHLILMATTVASGMAFLISTSLTIALPLIQSDFQTNLNGIQWVMNAYVLVVAVLLLTAGSLGDRYGRKRVFIIGIVICVLGSSLAGMAQTIAQLIAFQIVLGIGAATMIPGSLAIINASFTEAQRGQAIGLWSGLSAAIVTLGPFVGGWLIETFGWKSVFLINIPLGIIAAGITYFFIPESQNPDAREVDWYGALWTILGLFGISYGLIEAPLSGWGSFPVLASLLGGIGACGIFILTEKKVREPMVPLLIFQNPLVTGANLSSFFLYFALQGIVFFLIINFQQFQNYSPLEAGLAMLPSMFIIACGSAPSGALADKWGPRLPMTVGAVLVTLGVGSFILPNLQTYYFFHFFPGLVMFGTGMALVVPPLTKSALMVEAKFSGVASGINNAVTRIASLLAIAVLGALVVILFTNELQSLLQATSLSPEQQTQIAEQAIKLGDILIPDSFSDSHHQQTQTAIDEAFLYSFRWAMGICASFALLSALISAWLIRTPHSK